MAAPSKKYPYTVEALWVRFHGWAGHAGRRMAVTEQRVADLEAMVVALVDRLTLLEQASCRIADPGEVRDASC